MDRILGLLLIFISVPGAAQDWKWAGFEVVGHHKVTRANILKQIPIQVGATYTEDIANWEKWCADLRKGFGFLYAHCSSVRYADFRAYFVVDVVESGYEHRINYRSSPTGDIPLATPEILELYEQLHKRFLDLFNQGITVQESADKGYLDYSDKMMQNLVAKLVQLVPPYRANLLEVLEKDKDINKREKAAHLLNWSIHNLADSVVKANRLLDDPSDLVRNNISRFTFFFIDSMSSQTDRREVIDRLLIQLDHPSHGDRNKALANLLRLAHQFPSDREYIRSKGLPLIRYIAFSSILENVGDLARNLLFIVQSHP